jgi:protocatechuate 3,4-dioxygenase beta subunit
VAVECLVPGHLRAVLELEAVVDEAAALPTVALGRGYTITGEVLDGRGAPVVGVEVQAMPNPDLGEPEPWRAVTDAQGQFRFDTLPVGPVDLQAVKTGYALSVVEAVAPERDVLLVLEELIDLEGEVVAQPDRLPGAKVRLEGSAVWPPIEQPLGADGSFEFERLPDGVYGVEVVVPAQEEGGPEYASIPLENITPDLKVSVALVEAYRIPLRVVDPEGNPVPSARVTVGYASISLLQRQAETDVEGRARVGPFVPGPYVLRADATGYLPSEPIEVEVTGPDTKEQTLVLARPARIEGVVVDEDGRPVPDADVLVDAEGLFVAGESTARARLFGLAAKGGAGSLGVTQGKVPDIPKEGEEDLGVAGVLSDENGRFVLDMLRPGTYRLRAIHGLHAGSPLVKVELRSGQVVTGVQLKLRAGSLLTGVIRDGNGQPVPQAMVELEDGTRLLTDELGVFDAGFHTGKQEIIVRAPGRVPRRIPIEVGDTDLDLEIEMEEADAVLTGVVRDGNDRPIAGALVTIRMLDGLSPTELVETDDQGAFEVPTLAPGPAEIEVDHLDYVHASGKAMLEQGRTVDTKLVMEAGWRIPVRVRAKGTGKPLAGVRIEAGRQAVYTDRDGLVTLRKMQGKRVRLEVEAFGWTPVNADVARPAKTMDADEVLFELEEGGAIEGEITDERGEPVIGAEITITTPGGKTLASTRSRSGGAWRVDGLPEGDVIVGATPPDALAALLAPLRERSDIKRGQVTRDVQLRFDRL